MEYSIKENEVSFSRPNNLKKAQESFRDLSYGNWSTLLNSCCDFVHSQLTMKCEKFVCYKKDKRHSTYVSLIVSHSMG